MNIHDALEYGPIMASDDNLDAFVTVNGAYFNVWVGDGSGRYQNTEAFATGWGMEGLHGQKFTDVMDRAESILADALTVED